MEDWLTLWEKEKEANISSVLQNIDRLSIDNAEESSSKLRKIHDDVFQHFDCIHCAKCCKEAPPLITREDINRISKRLNISRKAFINKFLLEDINGENSFKQVPCVFLDKDQKCTIYEDRPLACRRYPHTDERDFPKRTKLNKKIVLQCPAAYKIIDLYFKPDTNDL